MSEETNVVPLPPRAEPPATEPVPLTLETIMALVEEMDRGMKIMVGIIADQDSRLRALELAQRKADRRNVPVIVNARGENIRSQ